MARKLSLRKSLVDTSSDRIRSGTMCNQSNKEIDVI